MSSTSASLEGNEIEEVNQIKVLEREQEIRANQGSEEDRKHPIGFSH